MWFLCRMVASALKQKKNHHYHYPTWAWVSVMTEWERGTCEATELLKSDRGRMIWTWRSPSAKESRFNPTSHNQYLKEKKATRSCISKQRQKAYKFYKTETNLDRAEPCGEKGNPRNGERARRQRSRGETTTAEKISSTWKSGER